MKQVFCIFEVQFAQDHPQVNNNLPDLYMCPLYDVDSFVKHPSTIGQPTPKVLEFDTYQDAEKYIEDHDPGRYQIQKMYVKE